MKKEFVMRGQTASGLTEVLNFSGHKDGYAYRLVEFQVYPGSGIGTNHFEISSSITAGKTAIDPTVPNFNDEGLIGTAMFNDHGAGQYTGITHYAVINDTFLITQNLILMVQDTDAGTPVNWQCRFVSVKMNNAEEAATNFKQFTISDE